MRMWNAIHLTSGFDIHLLYNSRNTSKIANEERELLAAKQVLFEKLDKMRPTKTTDGKRNAALATPTIYHKVRVP